MANDTKPSTSYGSGETENSTSFSQDSKPVFSELWSASVQPWLESLPWQFLSTYSPDSEP